MPYLVEPGWIRHSPPPWSSKRFRRAAFRGFLIGIVSSGNRLARRHLNRGKRIKVHGGAEPLRAHRIEDAVAAHRSQRRGNSLLQFLIARIDADAIAALGTKQSDGLHVDALDKRRIRANDRIGCDVLRFAGFDKRERRDQIGSGVQRIIRRKRFEQPALVEEDCAAMLDA